MDTNAQTYCARPRAALLMATLCLLTVSCREDGGEPAPTAPTINLLTATPASLPEGGGAVTLAWTVTGADTLSLDNGVGSVTGSSKLVQVTVSTDFTLTATNASGSVTQKVSVAVANNDRFVDGTNGTSSNDCSQGAPCNTIAKALTGIPAGASVFLADGVYDQASQGANVTLPDGVGLRATNPGGASFTGIALTAAGSATVSGIILDHGTGACASITATSTAAGATLSLSGVMIKCMDAIFLGGNVSATLTPGALNGGIYTAGLPSTYGGIIHLTNAAALLIQGGIVDGNNLGGVAFGAGLITASGTSTLTLDAVTVRNRAETIVFANQTSTVVLRNGTLFDTVGASDFDCADAAAIVVSGAVSVTLDHAQISNVPSAAICIRSGPVGATVQIVQSTVTQARVAIASEVGPGSNVVVTADGATFTNNTYGIDFLDSAGTSFDLQGSTFTGNQIGVVLSGGSLKLRTSNISNNTASGIELDGTVSADLGTTSDPGGNTFTGNTSEGLYDNLSTPPNVDAVGNTWNHSQGADTNGQYSTAPNYTPVPKLGPTSGPNFTITSAVTLNL